MNAKTNNGNSATLRLIAVYCVALIVGCGTFSTICLAQEQKPKTTDVNAKQEPSIRVDTITDNDGKEHQVIKAVPDEKGELFILVEEVPSFPGSDRAQIRYFSENIKYPEDAKKNGIQGTVFVSFVVEPDGSISNAQVLRGIGGGCDEEAIRVVENMPKWKSGKTRGKNVRVKLTLPIKFSLGSEN